MFCVESLITYLCAMLCASAAHAHVCSCPEHILCLHPGSWPGPNCKGHISSGFSADEKKAIIQTTNEYRSKVATGREILGSPGPQPPAADMIEVTWDDYLELTSQRWADQCTFEHSSTDCRKTDLGEYFGENLAISTYSHESMYDEKMFLGQIKRWYDEVKDFPEELVDDYQPWKQNKKIGHYAQLVNGPTYRIGCGRTRYAGGVLLVCHYKTGIYQSKPIYTRGYPASKCPAECIKSKYEGLCALEKYSEGSKNSYSTVLVASLFTLLFSNGRFI